MPAQPRKHAPAKRTAAKRTTPRSTPQQDAAAEAVDKPRPAVEVTFRGEQFTVAAADMDSPALWLADAMGDTNIAVLTMLGRDRDAVQRFLSVCRVGDTMAAVGQEFYDAYVAAAGPGNS